MNKLMFMVAVVATMVACGDKPNDSQQEGSLKLVVSIENGDTFTTVHSAGVELYNVTDDDYVPTGITPWNGGNFTLTLSKELEEAYFDDIFNKNDMPNGVSVSDIDAQGTMFYELSLYNEFEGWEGYAFPGYDNFDLVTQTAEMVEVMFMYSDRDTKMTGTIDQPGEDTSGMITDIDLKKGWNVIYTHLKATGIVYNEETEEYEPTEITQKMTTTKPNVNLKWSAFTWDNMETPKSKKVRKINVGFFNK